MPQAIYEIGKRDNQEDAIYPKFGGATEENHLFILCDGMGGHEKGEVASQTVCKVMAEYLGRNAGVDSIVSDSILLDALSTAYEKLDTLDDGADRKMGTTLCLLIFHHGGATAMHIGDSRIYHIRPSEHRVIYQSKDHSLVYDLYQSGEITYDEMQTSPQKNIITRAIQPGKDNRVKPSIVHITDIRPGDYFYICSDGMLEQMTNGELCDILSSHKSDNEKRLQLLKATQENKDNHSAYIIQIDKVEKETDDDLLNDEEQTSTDNAMNIKPYIDKPIEDVSIVTDNNEEIKTTDEKSVSKQDVNLKKGCALLPTLIIVSVVLLILLAFDSCQLKSRQELSESVKAFNSQLPIELADGMMTVTSCEYQNDVVELKYSIDESIINMKALKGKETAVRDNAKITLSGLSSTNKSFATMIEQMIDADASFRISFVGKQSQTKISVELDENDLAYIKEHEGRTNSEDMLRAMISSTNLQLPMRVDEMTTLTSVRMDGGDITLNYVIDESSDFSMTDMAAGSLAYTYQKRELLNSLRNRNTPDGRLADLCLKSNKYLVFHYSGKSTGQSVDIRLSPQEIRSGVAESVPAREDSYDYQYDEYSDSVY